MHLLLGNEEFECRRGLLGAYTNKTGVQGLTVPVMKSCNVLMATEKGNF